VNRADGISEKEGKAAMGSGERVGKGASFKSVVTLLGIWDLLPQAVSMVENNLAGLNGCDSLARSRVAPAGNP